MRCRHFSPHLDIVIQGKASYGLAPEPTNLFPVCMRSNVPDAEMSNALYAILEYTLLKRNLS